jgi:hypothetical protein
MVPSGSGVVVFAFDFESVSGPYGPSFCVFVRCLASVELVPDVPRRAMQALRSAAVGSDVQSESLVVVERGVGFSSSCARAGVVASNKTVANRCGRIQFSSVGLTLSIEPTAADTVPTDGC